MLRLALVGPVAGTTSFDGLVTKVAKLGFDATDLRKRFAWQHAVTAAPSVVGFRHPRLSAQPNHRDSVLKMLVKTTTPDQ